MLSWILLLRAIHLTVVAFFILRALLLHFGQTLKVTFVILAKFGLP